MTVITLTTDFGLRDGNVGVMKGVIKNIAPDADIVDISHNISPQNVMEGSLIIGRSAPYFPKGSIHVGVVDPGVGTDRRPIAARLGDQNFVGPDNGLFSVMLERAEAEHLPVEIYHTDQQEYWLPDVSNVFHGRDIFSPVAAHWASGVQLPELGTHIQDPIRLEYPQPQRTETGWLAQVMHIDHFGNLGINLRREDLEGLGALIVQVGDFIIHGLVRTFGERPPGELIALFGSTGYLAISEVNGSAATHTGAQRGDTVQVFQEKNP